MRDLAEPSRTGAAPGSPIGLAFELADLLLAQSRAAFNDSRIVILLDHGAEGEEYEEVIDVHTGRCSASRLIIWRSATGILVQPLLGRQQKFHSLADALESVFPTRVPKLTDIVATAWPIV